MATSVSRGPRRWSPSARKHENVYIDTSAYTARRYPPELVAYLKSRGGRHKVMFGSNFPMVFPAQALEDLDGLDLDQETRELFLHGNAERVLGIPPSGSESSSVPRTHGAAIARGDRPRDTRLVRSDRSVFRTIVKVLLAVIGLVLVVLALWLTWYFGIHGSR